MGCRRISTIEKSSRARARQLGQNQGQRNRYLTDELTFDNSWEVKRLALEVLVGCSGPWWKPVGSCSDYIANVRKETTSLQLNCSVTEHQERADLNILSQSSVHHWASWIWAHLSSRQIGHKTRARPAQNRAYDKPTNKLRFPIAGWALGTFER